MYSNHRKLTLTFYFDDGAATVSFVCRYVMRQKALVFVYLQLIVSFSHSAWEMDFFAILSDIVVMRSIAIDCKFRNFLEIVKTVAKTEEVLHLHFFVEFDKSVVKLRQSLSLELFGDENSFNSIAIAKLPISSWINFYRFFLNSDFTFK